MNSITIVIPLFSDSRNYVNRIPLIRRTLLGLSRQSDLDFKVVGINNDSFDDVTTLFYKYFPQGILVSYSVRGHRTAVRNFGAQQVLTTHFVFLDCDCIPYPTFIQNYKHFIAAHPDAVGQGKFYPEWGPLYLGDEFITIGSGKEELDYVGIEHMEGLRKTYRDFATYSIYHENMQVGAFELHTGDTALHTGNILFPTAAFHAFGGFDEEFKGWGYEDTMLGYTVRAHNMPVYIVHNVSVVHQNHRDGADKSHTEDCASAAINKEILDRKIASLQ